MSISALIWFLVGLTMHTLAAVYTVSRDPAYPHMTNFTPIIKARWVPILIRSTACLVVFVMWLQGQLADSIMAVGITLPGIVQKVLDLHIVGAMGWPIGFALDSAFEKIPAIKTALPPPVDSKG